MVDAYKDPNLSPDVRAADLLARMTLEEKIAQLYSLWLTLAEDGTHQARNDPFTGGTDQETLYKTLSLGLGQITRPLGGRPIEAADGVKALNTLQKFMIEETRLGIPVMSHEESLTGLLAKGATLFPSALAYGATWNPDLMEDIAKAIGAEARSVGAHQVLAPVLDVARDARWGRTEETFGEDPYLVGVMATRYVKGIQGDKRDLLATLKHYAGHSFSEGGRNHAPVNLGWRELNDTFLLPFEMAVRLADAGSVMPAYHVIDGLPCHANRHLLSEVLRDQWGFDGLIVADYTGVELLRKAQHIAADNAEAAAIAFNAGLDVELPGNECAPDLKQALERGLISMETLDATVTRVLFEKFRLGLFERPYADPEGVSFQTGNALDLARKAAQQSVVVLGNDGVLPLATDKKIAVIGPTADDPLALLSGYSFPVHLLLSDTSDGAEDVVTPRAAFEAVFGAENIVYARGCNILDERKYGAPVFPGDVADSSGLDIESNLSTRLDMIDAAVAAAKSADVAVVFVGDLSGLFQTGTSGEGSDADSLNLPGVQQTLLDAVVATGKPVIVVVNSGRPYTLGGLEDKLAAQVYAFANGQQGGPGLVDVLTGAVMPSGRLPISVPRTVGAVPYFYNHRFGSSGTPVARHFGTRYPFGHGLAYTDFAYEGLSLDKSAIDCQTGTLSVSFTVKNTGTRPGTAVPQLYVRDQQASVARPVKELKGFARVDLAPGEQKTVRVDLPTDMLNFTDFDRKRRVEPGQFDLMIGESSGDVRLSAVFALTGAVSVLSGAWRMLSTSTIA